MIRADIRSDSLDSLPLTESTFLLLIGLEGKPNHGYAIMKEVKALSRGRVALSTGTLYGAIKRLLEDGWIRRVRVPDAETDGRKRKIYALTRRGRRVLDAEIQRLRELVEIAGRRLAPEAQRGAD